jgi:hypothetical protein
MTFAIERVYQLLQRLVPTHQNGTDTFSIDSQDMPFLIEVLDQPELQIFSHSGHQKRLVSGADLASD